MRLSLHFTRDRRVALQCVTIVALGALALGPSGLTQWVAWGSMLVQRAWNQGMAVAFATTFDGASPCAICGVAAELRSEPWPSNIPRPTGPDAPKVGLIWFIVPAVVPMALGMVPPQESGPRAKRPRPENWWGVAQCIFSPEPPPPRWAHLAVLTNRM